MLTSLSQKIRRILNPSLRTPAAAEVVAAPVPVAIAAASEPAAAPGLRLVRDGESTAVRRDISIRVAAGSTVGASVFVAGQGARLYSLDVFRAARQGGRPGPGSPAAPFHPRAA